MDTEVFRSVSCLQLSFETHQMGWMELGDVNCRVKWRMQNYFNCVKFFTMLGADTQCSGKYTLQLRSCACPSTPRAVISLQPEQTLCSHTLATPKYRNTRYLHLLHHYSGCVTNCDASPVASHGDWEVQHLQIHELPAFP